MIDIKEIIIGLIQIPLYVINDIKVTINSARSISTKIDDMSDDFQKLTQDKELTKSIRDITIGLSKFLNEIYP